MTEPLLRVRDLRVHFPVRGRTRFGRPPAVLKAVDGVSFDLHAGETLGVVGESGCGKSTLARAVLRLIAPTAGRIAWLGTDIAGLGTAAMRPYRRHMQVIFQDPLASLDPRMTVGESVGEPLRACEPGLDRAARETRVAEAMERVGLLPHLRNRYPHEFSGGQCQRIGIARAIVLGPKLIVCDEPVSALDVSIQAQIVNLLAALRRATGTSLIFISHDLSVVRHISDRVMVLYLGKVMEMATREAIYTRARHPYTRALVAAVPLPDPERERAKPRLVLEGDVPSALSPPSGCVFRTRCPHATERCAREAPTLESEADDPGHEIACHHWRGMAGRPAPAG